MPFPCVLVWLAQNLLLELLECHEIMLARPAFFGVLDTTAWRQATRVDPQCEAVLVHQVTPVSEVGFPDFTAVGDEVRLEPCRCVLAFERTDILPTLRQHHRVLVQILS